MSSVDYLNSVSEAIDFIEEKVCDPLSVKDVCEISHLSSWQFQRVFRAYVGDSIGNYIRGRRLTLAAKYLKEHPNIGILDVSLMFQFSSQEAFSRAFKKIFKESPAKFRSDPPARIVFSKPRLDREKIEHIKTKYSKEPSFKQIENKKLVGISKEVLSPFGIETELRSQLVGLWDEFNLKRRDIKTLNLPESYGVISSPKNDMNGDKLTYTASCEVAEFDGLDESIELLELPEANYAVFEVLESDRQCHLIVDYIYGIWLPQSGYERIDGVDFEYYDHRQFRLNDPFSVSYYCLPVKSL